MKAQLLVLRRSIIPVLLATMLGMATLSGCSLLDSLAKTTPPPDAETVYQTSLIRPNLADVIADVRPSVVAINTESNVYNPFRGSQTVQGAGSGWVIDSDGLIVTNSHVVEDASVVTVTLDDGRVFPALEIYTDTLSDLAIIKIDASNLRAAKIGIPNPTVGTLANGLDLEMVTSSYTLRMGDWVVALGNSLGMGISATHGIVSATGVSVQYDGKVLYNLIQTDAAINAGNSGGPLVNLAGEVIGINSAKISSVGVEGMGYAISMEEAYPILKQLINYGYVARMDIGAELATVTKAVASYSNLKVDYGALVTKVLSGGPADEAGLRVSDVIVAVDDTSVVNAEGFIRTLQSYEAGQEVQITYYRNSNKRTVSITLIEAS